MTSTNTRDVSHGDGPQADEDFFWLLVAQRKRLIRLRSDLQTLASDDSERWDAANLVHQESAAQLSVIEERLEATDQALERWEAGQFGVCVECGDALPAERLKIRLDARLCVPCCQSRRGPA
jgi:RNA polymerase-binding transcription factor DksA